MYTHVELSGEFVTLICGPKLASPGLDLESLVLFPAVVIFL